MLIVENCVCFHLVIKFSTNVAHLKWISANFKWICTSLNIISLLINLLAENKILNHGTL